MNDIDDFFAEQDRLMSIPDEDVDEYIRARFTAAGKDQSTNRCASVLEDITVPPANSPRQHMRSSDLKTARENNDEEITDTRNELNSVSLGFLPGSSTVAKCTSTTACSVKRRKTTREISIPKPSLCFSEGPNPDPNTSRTTARNRAVSAKQSMKYRSTNPVGTSGGNSMPSFINLAPQCDRGPVAPFVQAQMRRTTDQAVPAAKEAYGFSSHANTPGSKMEVQTPQRQGLGTPPVSTPDNPSVMGGFSLPPISSRRNVPVFSSTSFDGHGWNSSGSPENPSYLSAVDGVQGIAVTAEVHPTTLAPSSSRIPDDSHEAGGVEENLTPVTPAGFNTAASLDVSNITSPADTPSGQSRHASRASLPITNAQPSSSTMFVPKELKARKTVNSGRRSKKATTDGAGSKKMKEKPKLITPLEYAQKLQSCLDLPVKTNYLKGKRIFYIGGDMMYASITTKGRMEYVVKHGGTLVPRYDPAIVTHIVTDAGIRHTLQALSLKSLSDVPNHIPTVTWGWVVSGYKRTGKQQSRLLSDTDDRGESGKETDRGNEDDPFDFEFMHAAFPERIDAGRSWKTTRQGKQGGKASHDLALESSHDDSGDISHISTFSQESKPTQVQGRGAGLTVLSPPPLLLKVVYGGKPEGHATSEGEEKAPENGDPLAEYYAQAKADREARWNQDVSDSDDGDDDFDYHRAPVPRRGFTCDLKGQKPVICVNQHIVDKLEELRELHKAKSSEDDRWRTYSYGKCIPAIRNYPKPIRSFSEARSIRGVGEKTAVKVRYPKTRRILFVIDGREQIMEIINTGDLERIKYENTEDVTATKVFQGIYGVGRHTAFSWFASGLRTLNDVKARKGGLKLSLAQEIGLRFYEDINSRMPREETRRIFETIKLVALAIDSKLFIEIMGSYRRGKADCGDIDILITRPTADGKTHQGVLRTLLEKLHAAGIITEDLAVPEDFSDLELIYRGLCRLPEVGAKRRRIDFLCVPWENRGAALLYYTGDDIFNRAMRLKANRHGYSLNQRGLYSGVVRDPRDRQKVCEGHIVASETEEEIFKILGVPWQEPHERVRG